ncbi:MAG: hypothetical protein GY786_22730 [Proteobacteria bacterium]|nr:hypothetical protein [Pseudomonadota bacterium]
MKKQHKVELFLLKSVYTIFRVLPFSITMGFGRALGSLVWGLGIRKNTTLTNLKLAFPDKYSDQELDRIAKQAYIHFGQEAMRLLRMDKEARPLDEWVEIEGLENIQKTGSKGGILVGGHLGCWELVNFVLIKLGEDVTIYTGSQSNKMTGKLVDEIRAKVGGNIISSKDEMSDLGALSKSQWVALVGDQKPAKSPIYVEFFGRETQAAQGPALLSLLNEVDYVYFSCIKVGDKIKIRFQKVEIERTSSRKKNVLLLTKAYFDLLQKDVEQTPEQYLWMHRRWKNDEAVVYKDRESLL